MLALSSRTGLGEDRLKFVRLPRPDCRRGNPHLRGFMQGELAEHRHLQQHQRTAHKLGKSQPVEESQFSGAEKVHRGGMLAEEPSFRKPPRVTNLISASRVDPRVFITQKSAPRGDLRDTDWETHMVRFI